MRKSAVGLSRFRVFTFNSCNARLPGQQSARNSAAKQILKIARKSLLEVRDLIQGAQVSAPFGNVKYALEVFSVLEDFKPQSASAIVLSLKLMSNA